MPSLWTMGIMVLAVTMWLLAGVLIVSRPADETAWLGVAGVAYVSTLVLFLTADDSAA